MERRTFSVTFFIRRTRLHRNNEAPVFMRITLGGERSEMQILRTIQPSQWNSTKGCAKSTTNFGKELNDFLNQVRINVYQYHQDLLAENATVTAAALKAAFIKGTGREAIPSLLTFYREHNENLKSMIDRGVSRATYIRHETSRRNLERFLHEVYHKDDIGLKEIKHGFIKDYETYLRTVYTS